MKWKLTRDKYLTVDEWKTLRQFLRERAKSDKARGRVSGIRQWAMIDFVYQTGMRVGEAADVKIGDLDLEGKQAGVWVRSLKKHSKNGNRPAWVPLGTELVKHLKGYLKFKSRVGEPNGEADYLLVNKFGNKYATRGLQKLFKEACKGAELPSYFSIHALRHSCGTHLYQKTKDLRLVQKHLRHESVQTTQIYADVTSEEQTAAVNGAFNYDDEDV